MTFAIDFQNQMIFWADASGLIETAMLDGTARSVIFQGSKVDSIGLALNAQFIYITDTTTRRIQKIDRNTKQLSNLTKILFSQPFALLYYPMDTASTETTSATKTTSGDNNKEETVIVVASVISGSVVLIAVLVTVGVVVVKRRRAAPREDEPSLADLSDNSPYYETLDTDRRSNSNPQVFTNEPDYDDEIVNSSRRHSYASIKYSSEYPTERQTVAPPPYEDGN